ncbi:MAG: hypothetical protein QM681_11500 [Novosphingobium sp.]
MTDARAPGASTRLYSQTACDERGNFHYEGDLHRAGETLGSIASRLGLHLTGHFAGACFAITTHRFTGGRKVLVEILDSPGDLTDREEQKALLVAVQDQMERFSFTRSNVLQDFHNCSFFCEARIAQAYWAALARRRGARNPVASLVSLSAFKKRVKPGDSLKLIDAPAGHRSLGVTRAITAVRSGDLILEGRRHLDYPRASAFACDGRLVRISIGSDHDPDAHLLYEWIKVS